MATEREMKNFIKKKYGIVVRTRVGTGYLTVYLDLVNRTNQPLDHLELPEELGIACTKTLYKNNQLYSSNVWSPGITPASISMHMTGWDEVIERLSG